MNEIFRLLNQLIAAFSIVMFVPVSEAKEIVGYVEKVQLYPGAILVRAKLDTGSRTSSLGVAHFECFTGKDGRRVRFSVSNWKRKKTAFDLLLVRVANIKRRFGRVETRPVVRLGICLGDVYRETEVNLVDRAGYNYQMLIGRQFLESRFVVDPDRHYTLKPECRLE